MSFASPLALRTLAFGDLDSGRWGLVSAIGGDDLLAGAAAAAAELAVEPAHEWTVVNGAGEEGEQDVPPLLSARICTVRVREQPGAEPVEHLGIEIAHAIGDFAELDSLRQVLAWFAPDDALAVSCERPLRTAGHDHDRVLAAMFEPDGPLAIDEARLSTTYGAGGVASRMSLELWTSEEEHGYPRRAAGEASAEPVTVAGAAVRVEVHPMRCHRAGRDGPGLYLLARPLVTPR